MNISQYLEIINKRFKSGISREHSYRADLEQLISTLVPDVDVTNEPANVTDCGNPDYVITKGKIPIGYIEAKDIGKDLNSKSYKEQFTRYKKALDNLIITDYVWFQFFQQGELVYEVKIAELNEGVLTPIEANFKGLESHIKDFCTFVGQTIKSSQKLAKMMASKARLFQDILEQATTSDETNEADSSLKEQYKAFQQVLIHDITPKAFADIYAQTLAYGMFAARLHDQVLDTFSRQEAAEKIPKSNPFLRKLFQYIAGYDIDPRIIPAVNNLADVFRATNVRELLKDFGKSTQQTDPIIHFYETFLAEYDPKLRKARGVWYTPEPVVKFIVRAVDEVLKDEFGIKDGLADTSKIKVKRKTQTLDRRKKENYKEIEQEVHKVQILDPATGTGTFLAEVIKFIYNGKFKAMQGVWSSYVENDLIPRLNGFELLMASYAMAHLKLDMLLEETGFKSSKEQRLRVYLTNSLEEYHPDTNTLFANWLSSEANEANLIKRDTPVMCVLGNPPYAVSSTNKNDWINNLIADYKKDLKEKSYNSLSDDYVKFIRYGQHYIEKNGSGVLAYISNNSFIDGIVFRQMRKNLLECFDKIYILDLHGNSMKKEASPEGAADINVFDIQQGVSINIFVKTDNKKSNEMGKLFQFDLYGKRGFKYDFLEKNSISSLNWNAPTFKSPNYFFTNKNYKGEEEYKKGFSIEDLFVIKAAGIKTHKDSIVIAHNDMQLKVQIEDYLQSINDTAHSYSQSKIKTISYRPFDKRLIYYDTKLVTRHREKQIRHSFFNNISLLSGRQTKNKEVNHFFISDALSEMKTAESSTGSYHFQLYTYKESDGQLSISEKGARIPNLNTKIVKQISE
jgi:predicted helicase